MAMLCYLVIVMVPSNQLPIYPNLCGVPSEKIQFNHAYPSYHTHIIRDFHV